MSVPAFQAYINKVIIANIDVQLATQYVELLDVGIGASSGAWLSDLNNSFLNAEHTEEDFIDYVAEGKFPPDSPL